MPGTRACGQIKFSKLPARPRQWHRRDACEFLPASPPDKLESQDVEMLRVALFQFFESLLHFRSGWFANQRTGCKSFGKRFAWS